MIKKTIYIIALLFSFACKTTSLPQNITGVYQQSGKDFKYRLALNADSTFKIILQDLEIKKQCEGKWSYRSERKILIKCNEADTTKLLSSGYMDEREHILTIINPEKIKFRQIILEKAN